MVYVKALDLTKDPIDEKQLVFALIRNRMPWPCVVLHPWNAQSCRVQFILFDDTYLIINSRIWPYNTRSKREFINVESLKSDDFCKAVVIAESLLAKPQPITPADPSNREELLILDQMQYHCKSLSIEPKFVRTVNALRRFTYMKQPNYEKVKQALLQLIVMDPISQLLLVRNPRSITFLRHFIGYLNYLNPSAADRKKIGSLYKRLQRRLVETFNASCFADFWFMYEMRVHIYETHAKAYGKRMVSKINTNMRNVNK